jgi:membrane protease YdiL (CAAX protease family)
MGRLQRDYSGDTIPVSNFKQVLYRHGLTMGGVALALILLASNLELLRSTLTGLTTDPTRYLLAVGVILAFFYFLLKRRHLNLNIPQALWIVYLLYISIVEEIAFRLYLPAALAPSASLPLAIVLSNFVFALLHYFTLRWKLSNCIFAFFGGIGLTNLLQNSGDLTLVILVHFVATFINTPTQPSKTDRTS